MTFTPIVLYHGDWRGTEKRNCRTNILYTHRLNPNFEWGFSRFKSFNVGSNSWDVDDDGDESATSRSWMTTRFSNNRRDVTKSIKELQALSMRF
ncbi:hypothetical protein MtrunA17_Chr8g0388391 [Medicago truncatula]|uniref:Uncharacterized protein n=1 Tax=Medicago truncatula TaxID=3880 RepID=A0A396GXX0_MEDTR|nr:hypothetical protein MtrunA17_Chr8g0388391 [Medicago truncatula]